MNTKRHTWKVLGACLLAAIAVAACASSGTPASSTSSSTTPAATTTSTTPAATSPASSAPAGAIAAITTNWATFFNSKTSVAKRVSLLQDGPQFAKIITAQQHSPLAAGLTAKVKSVSNLTNTQADVKYNLIVGGSKVPMTGIAVYEDGTWKVGVMTFCGLLHLEGLKSMPAVCSSAT